MENINSSSKDIFSNYKYQIIIFSYYIEEIFKSINSSLLECEKNLQTILTNKKSSIILNTKDISSQNSENNSCEEIEELINYFSDVYKKKNIGKYNWKIRLIKILKYKMKTIIRHIKNPIITKYSGRSKIANEKPRLNGRFIKKKKPIFK